jgi:hypothetical protein
MISSKPDRSQIFISYSHQDAKWLARLRVHLKPLERDYGIVIWDDTEIKPGSSWRAEIAKSISSAKVAILLISADFLASDFIANDELPHLLQAANTEGAIILPIVVSPSLFLQTPTLAKFQTVNDPAKPLTGLPRAAQEAIFVRVSEIIQRSFSESSEPDSTSGRVVNPETEGRRKMPIDSPVVVKQMDQTESSLPWYKRTIVIVALIGAFSTLAGTAYKFGLPYIIDGPSHSVAVRGRVSDVQGRAIRGAKVSLEGKGLPPVIYTDSEGVFSFDLPADVKEIKIRVEATGYGAYDRRIDVSAKGDLQDIRLPPTENGEKAELSGTVLDASERPLQGGRVTLDDIPGMSPVETSSDGVFNLRDIPRKYGEGVRVRVVMEGYLPYTEDVVLGKAPPIIKLTRKR